MKVSRKKGGIRNQVKRPTSSNRTYSLMFTLQRVPVKPGAQVQVKPPGNTEQEPKAPQGEDEQKLMSSEQSTPL